MQTKGFRRGKSREPVKELPVFAGVAGGAGADVGVLRKQLADCKEERDVLKVVTQRVNCDLARYQAEYRHLTQAEVTYFLCYCKVLHMLL